MGSYENHFEYYKLFKKDAENKNNFEGTRVEAYFLSAYHMIESCAAREGMHINSPTKVKEALVKNPQVIGMNTKDVWRSFQTILEQLRPKFAFTLGWTAEDIEDVQENYRRIEAIGLRALI